jgi:hypothetical protein
MAEGVVAALDGALRELRRAAGHAGLAGIVLDPVLPKLGGHVTAMALQLEAARQSVANTRDALTEAGA